MTKQFLKHTDADVLDQAVQTISFLLASTTLGNTNTAKMAELEESLVSSLRNAVAGKDIESSAFEEDELLALTAWVARIDKLYKTKDLSSSLNDTDGGQQTSSWEIVDSLVERGRLGYKDEASVSVIACPHFGRLGLTSFGVSQMVEHALSILGSHLAWETLAFAAEAAEADEPDYAALASIVERRGTLLEKLEEFSVGHNSNAAEGVKQVVSHFTLSSTRVS